MTTRKRRPQHDDDDDRPPSFSQVWKVALSVVTGVMTLAVAGLGSWVWSTNNSLTNVISATNSNTDTAKSLIARMDREQEVNSAQAATLAALQVQIGSIQTAQVSAVGTIAERVRSLEQQNMWRDRLGGNSSAGKGR